MEVDLRASVEANVQTNSVGELDQQQEVARPGKYAALRQAYARSIGKKAFLELVEKVNVAGISYIFRILLLLTTRLVHDIIEYCHLCGSI